MRRLSTYIAVALVLTLSGCATGEELKGSWLLTVGRDKECRVVMHRAKTDQLETSTVWRGERCFTAGQLQPIDGEGE
jgi:hypothetical protein